MSFCLLRLCDHIETIIICSFLQCAGANAQRATLPIWVSWILTFNTQGLAYKELHTIISMRLRPFRQPKQRL